MVMSKTTTVVVDGFAEVLVQRCRTELDPDLLVQRLLGQCNQGDLLMKHHTDFSPELFKKKLGSRGKTTTPYSIKKKIYSHRSRKSSNHDLSSLTGQLSLSTLQRF
jgi:hypothetical protein